MFSFFKKLFQIQNDSKTEKRPTHLMKKQVINNQAPTEIINRPQLSEANELTTHLPATVLIKFINEHQQPLQTPLILQVFLGDALKLTIPRFSGYQFKTITGMSSKIMAQNQIITIHYQKELGQPIMLYCFDYDDNQLLKTPEFMSGLLGNHYQITPPKIEGYQLHLALGNQSGTYSKNPETVVLYYRRSDWKTVQTVNYLVQIKAGAVVYAQPNNQHPYEFKLPIGSTWKVFREVWTNQETWLSLGGAEWIKKDYTTRIKKPQKALN